MRTVLNKTVAKVAALGSALAFVAPALAQTYYYSSSSSTADGVSLLIYCCCCLLCLPFLALQIYLIVDSFKRNYGADSNMQIVGLLLLLLIGFPVGSILYYFLIMKKYPKKA
jgi:drug/metabolite transporter (DMT)-like permease